MQQIGASKDTRDLLLQILVVHEVKDFLHHRHAQFMALGDFADALDSR